MPRKVTDGPIRNKERTRQRVIDALGNIVIKDGFSNLNISKIAEQAQVDRKVIYDYFGGLDGVIKEYLDTKDYWKVVADNMPSILEHSKADHGKSAANMILEQQFDSLMSNEEMRRIVTWDLTDNVESLQVMGQKREDIGEQLFTQLTDEHFKNKTTDIRAVTAILVSSVYYLTLHAKMNGSTFCGIDIREQEGEMKIKKALRQIIDWAYAQP